MILQSLDHYYYRLLSETDGAGKPKVPDYGFSEEKIGWIIVLSREGDWIDQRRKPSHSFWQKIHLALFVSDISNFCRKSKMMAYERSINSW